MEIIPAIDIISGKCVRLEEGRFEKMTVYENNPLDAAMRFEDAGLKRLHLVDLDGAREGKIRNWKALETIAGRTKLVIDFGGGINSEEDLRIVFNSGAEIAAIGSLAVKQKEIFIKWIELFGRDRFFPGADCKEEKILVKGWTEGTEISVFDFIRDYSNAGLKYFFCTDVSKDGKLEGPSTSLYKRIISQIPGIKLVASGGISSITDLEELQDCGCWGAIIGKAIYEKRISLADLKKWTYA